MSSIHIGAHFFGAGNIGDDLMLAGFLGHLGRSRSDLRITCCCPHDLSTQRRRFPQVEWLDYSTARRRTAIEQARVWVCPGGSPFQSDDGDWFTPHLVEEADLCLASGVPMFWLGVGVNDASSLDDLRLARVLAQAAGVWARDDHTARLLEGRGRIYPGADLAHLFLRERPRPKQGDGLAVCLNFHDDLAPHVLALERFLDRVPAVFGLIGEVRELPRGERALYAQLSPAYRQRVALCLPDYAASNCEGLLKAWPSCEAVLSSRYHAALIEAWAGARVGVLAINDKLRGLAEDLSIACFAGLDEVNLAQLGPVAPATLEERARQASASVDAWLEQAWAPKRPARGPCHVGAISPDSLGDLVLRQPLFKTLLDHGHRVTVAVSPGLLRLVPLIDGRLESMAIPIDPYRVHKPDGHLEKLSRFVGDLQAQGVEMVLCPAFNRTVVDMAVAVGLAHLPHVRLSPGIAPHLAHAQRLGLDSVARPPLTVEVSVSEKSHETAKYRSLLELGFDLRPETERPRLSLSAASIEASRDQLQERGLREGGYVLFCPIGSANVSIKAVPDALTLVVARCLWTDWSLPVLLIGIESERDRLELLAHACSEAGIESHLWLGGPDDLECLVGLIALARLYFGGDTGPMHLAAALDVPVAAVFGGGTWPRFTPSTPWCYAAVSEMECFGCSWDCPYEKPRCIDAVSEAALLDGVNRLMQSTAGNQSAQHLLLGDHGDRAPLVVDPVTDGQSALEPG